MSVVDAHLLLVDPDETKRGLLKTFLSRRGFLVSAARDLDHAARLLSGLDFDLIVMEAAEGHRALCDLTDAPVLWLVAPGEKREGEVLEKPFEPEALTDKVNAVLDRLPPPVEVKPTTLKLGRLTYAVDQAVLRDGETPVRLTGTEVKLMRALAARPGAPLTRAELADVVEADPDGRAVDVQITRLRRKLEVDPKLPKVLQTVRGTGYMLVPN